MSAVFNEKAWSYAFMKRMLIRLGARLDRTSFLGWDNDQWNAVGDWAWYQLYKESGPVPARCQERPSIADKLFEGPKAGRKRR